MRGGGGLKVVGSKRAREPKSTLAVVEGLRWRLGTKMKAAAALLTPPKVRAAKQTQSAKRA